MSGFRMVSFWIPTHCNTFLMLVNFYLIFTLSDVIIGLTLNCENVSLSHVIKQVTFAKFFVADSTFTKNSDNNHSTSAYSTKEVTEKKLMFKNSTGINRRKSP